MKKPPLPFYYRYIKIMLSHVFNLKRGESVPVV